MSKYKFSLHNYHAIKSADIVIDGITVLSGENGCGKSTLSQWLYYIVNCAENFDKYIYNSFIHTIIGKINRLNISRTDVTGIFRRPNDNNFFALLYDGKKELRSLLNDACQENMEKAVQIYGEILDEFVLMLPDYLKQQNRRSSLAMERMFKYLDLEVSEQEDIDASIKVYSASQKKQAEEDLELCMKDQNERKATLYFDLLRSAYRITDKQPENIQLEEDGVELLQKRKTGILYNLNRAIYVDTPMAVSEESTLDKKYWKELLGLMMTPADDIHLSKEEQKLMLQITRQIKGKIEVKKGFFTGSTELHYVREDGLDIKLNNVATGYKSFAYLLRLLENGYMNSSTLLLIDEPEAHLHPQFIVEFARLLVLLNKRLGVKIMIASHNPDMVVAIKSIAQKEDITDTTRFYIAERSAEDYTYTYRDLGNDIEDIFKSFNIALERIDQYGSSSI